MNFIKAKTLLETYKVREMKLGHAFELVRELSDHCPHDTSVIVKLLNGLPLETIIVNEDKNGYYCNGEYSQGIEVLATIYKFIIGELEIISTCELNGKTFDMLPPYLLNRLEDSSLLIFYVKWGKE